MSNLLWAVPLAAALSALAVALRTLAPALRKWAEPWAVVRVARLAQKKGQLKPDTIKELARVLVASAEADSSRRTLEQEPPKEQ